MGFGFLVLLAVSCAAAGAEPAAPIDLVARDPAGHGLLCRSQGKNILIVEGTPEQMGAAHGTLLRESVKRLCRRVVYLVGGADSFQSGTWFLDRMAEIQSRTLPHIPPRFLAECDALSAAAGVSTRDGRYANLLPERFHCSGVAVRGTATTDGRVIHARVLDYMTEVGLQDEAVLVVYLPGGHHAWLNQSYAGFVGTVTAMNEKGLAVGEMGGGGDGRWDGMPMSFLLRDVMERASTVDEALEILRNTPRTCEYYYVLSDKSRAMAGVYATPDEMHPELPPVPQDTVLISGSGRAEALSERIRQSFGKIDVAAMIQIIKRPVAMQSNLHDAVFTPETLDVWFADASRTAPACDQPYAHVNLADLIRFYRNTTAENGR
jgi:hypothetical protein